MSKILVTVVIYLLHAAVYAQPSCVAFNKQLAWPTGGEANKDWVVQYYMDTDTAPGIADYTGVVGKNARTYAGHRGMDIVVPTFKWVDENLPVFAAADGKVIAMRDGEKDRNTLHDVESLSNVVELQHANGFRTVYAHLKKHSVAVQLGDWIKQGQRLGAVGSSGNSSWPHLHFEVSDCASRPISSMAANMWQNAPAYEVPFKLLDLVLLTGYPDGDIRQLILSGQQGELTFNAGDYITLSPIVAGGFTGDRLTLALAYPDGSEYKKFDRVFEKAHGGSFWYWYFKLPEKQTGIMRITIRLNGEVDRIVAINVI